MRLLLHILAMVAIATICAAVVVAALFLLGLVIFKLLFFAFPATQQSGIAFPYFLLLVPCGGIAGFCLGLLYATRLLGRDIKQTKQIRGFEVLTQNPDKRN